MYLTVSIDTEEDNWGEFARPDYTVRNVGRIPRLQEIFNRRGIRPTYLISYPVATSGVAIEMLGGYAAAGLCEIGTHPHPWNTPPVEEQRTPFNSFICHLPAALQYRKIATLTDTIERNFGTRPTSFRCGRWGFDDTVAANLLRLGYLVDSSISPTWNWSLYEGPDFSQASHEPFAFRLQPQEAANRGSLLEVPATIDYLQSNRRRAAALSRAIARLPFANKIAAGLSKLRLLNNVSVSPEMNSAADMIRLSQVLLKRGTRVINMFFHSPTLLEGCTPFVRSSADAEAFLARIDTFLAFAHAAGLQSVALSDLTPAGTAAARVRVLPGAAALLSAPA